MAQITDAHGNPVTGATRDTAEAFDQAMDRAVHLSPQSMPILKNILKSQPDFAMASIMMAHLMISSHRPEFNGLVKGICDGLKNQILTEREKLHLAALDALLTDRSDDAREWLEDILIEHPRDLLALHFVHFLDFNCGDARAMRDRIARALRAWSPDVPNYGQVLGMYAFALEESGDYGRAEEFGRRSVELDNTDCWGQHAVAHTLEMLGRFDDGIAWQRGNVNGWTADSFFDIHNWWHLALFHLEKGEVAEALQIYDTQIFRGDTGMLPDFTDAAAFLWRLKLRGIDVGDRWQPVADLWVPRVQDGCYAFHDLHAVIAFVGAGRRDLTDELLAVMRKTAEGDGDNARATAEVGLPVVEALAAYGEGDATTAIRKLRPVRTIAQRVGGSHAQRDLLDLTLLAAACETGHGTLAQALAAERLALRPNSPLNQELQEQAHAA